jgi:hypothetical protein
MQMHALHIVVVFGSAYLTKNSDLFKFTTDFETIFTSLKVTRSKVTQTKGKDELMHEDVFNFCACVFRYRIS